MPIMLEAVMRVRASKGLGLSIFHSTTNVVYSIEFRSADGVIPRKLLCQIYGSARDASCAH